MSKPITPVTFRIYSTPIAAMENPKNCFANFFI